MSIMLKGNRNFDYDIVGEGNYQRLLKKVAGGYQNDFEETETVAGLIFEDSNKYDPLAVAVMMTTDDDDGIVGYLAKDEARLFRMHVCSLLDGGAILCRAKITGGWNNGPDDKGAFGVRLDLAWPLEIDFRR